MGTFMTNYSFIR